MVSGSSVSSAGFPRRVEGGTISPLAPRRVCSLTSLIWLTYPNRWACRACPLRIGLASGSEIDTSRSVIGSPATRWRIWVATFSHRFASSSSCSAALRLVVAPRPTAGA
jgi:hypothetical protein